MRFELTTFALARRRTTAVLLPHSFIYYHVQIKNTSTFYLSILKKNLNIVWEILTMEIIFDKIKSW